MPPDTHVETPKGDFVMHAKRHAELLQMLEDWRAGAAACTLTGTRRARARRAAAALAAVATPNPPIAVFKNSTITVVLKIKQRPHRLQRQCSLLFGLSVCGWWLVMMMGGVVDSSSQWEPFLGCARRVCVSVWRMCQGWCFFVCILTYYWTCVEVFEPVGVPSKCFEV